MNVDALNRWLTLAANVGVVIGLVVVVAELRHTAAAAEVAAYQTRVAEIQNMHLELALSSELAAILQKYNSEGINAVTPAERLRVRAWCQVILRQMQGQYYQYQKGFLEREVIDRTLFDISNGIYQSWEQLDLLERIENEEWRAEIDKTMKEVGES